MNKMLVGLFSEIVFLRIPEMVSEPVRRNPAGFRKRHQHVKSVKQAWINIDIGFYAGFSQIPDIINGFRIKRLRS